MSDLDNEIQDWYADQEPEPAFLDKLLAMEAQADTAGEAEASAADDGPRPANDTRGFVMWIGLGVVGLAAAAALVVAVPSALMVGAEPVPDRFTQIEVDIPTSGTTSGPANGLGDAVADLGVEQPEDASGSTRRITVKEYQERAARGEGPLIIKGSKRSEDSTASGRESRKNQPRDGKDLHDVRNPWGGDAGGGPIAGGTVDATTAAVPVDAFARDVKRIEYDLDTLTEPTGVSNGSSAHPLLNGQVTLGLDGKESRNRGHDANAQEWQAIGADLGMYSATEYRAAQDAAKHGDHTGRDDDGDGVSDVLSQLGYLDADGRFANVIVDGQTGGWVDRGWRPAHTLSTTDALSTFSVDVDTGAWTRSRRAISEGYLPQPAEVRPEEFINAFRYDYEGPTSGPFAASTEVVPSPFDGDRYLVRIGVQGKRISVFERKPVHLTFLVDVSGSMQSADRLPLVKHGLKMLVGELRDGDTVAVVTYAGNTRIALEPTSVTERQTILRAIDGLSSSGGTAMGAGIDLAYGLAEATLEPGAINRVVLASDGDANVGETDADRLAQKLRAAADKGITLTTLGFGTGNYRDDVMERLADKGDGHYHYIANDKDARKVLVDGLTGTLQTIARDVKLQVEFDPSVVTEWRQIGYDNRQIADRDFRNDRVDAGEVGAGHQVTALYEVKLVDPSVASVLGDLRVRYEAPGAEGAPAVERAMKLVGTPRESLREASDGTRVAVVAAAFAERLRQHPGPALSSLDDLLPVRPEYAEDDGELRQAIQGAIRLGLR